MNTATLTCPKCGHQQKGEIPDSSCIPFYVCDGCKETIQAKEDDCCVLCSYADKACPVSPIRNEASNGVSHNKKPAEETQKSCC